MGGGVVREGWDRAKNTVYIRNCLEWVANAIKSSAIATKCLANN